MKRNAYADSTIKKVAKLLRHLKKNCNTVEPEEVKLYIANKTGKNWLLHFKGIIAVLLIQPQPKMWSEKWTKIFENYVKSLRNSDKRYTIAENGKDIYDITDLAKRTPNELREFENWKLLSNFIKKKMEEGFINFDVIKNKTLLLLILSEFSDDPIKKA
jgi:hypothetical protein